MRVVLLVNALRRHGPGLMVHSMGRGLPERGFDVTVVSLDPPDAQLVADLEAHGVPVVTMPPGRGAMGALRRLLRRHQADILHTHGLRADLLGRTVGRLGGVRVLSTLHDAPTMYRLELGPVKGQLAIVAQVLSLHLTDGMVAVADAVRLAYEGLWPMRYLTRRYQTIYNGVPDHYLAGNAGQLVQGGAIEGGQVVIGTLARLVPRKGIDYLLRAAALLAPRYAQVRYLIAGEGDQGVALQARAEALGLGDRFCLVGARSDTEQALAEMDIFVLPSLDECLPLSILEAMSAARPVVATRVGGVGEAVVEGESGLLVPPADADALAAALARLVEDPALRARMGAAARQRYLERFRDETMIAQYAELYARWKGDHDTHGT